MSADVHGHSHDAGRGRVHAHGHSHAHEYRKLAANPKNRTALRNALLIAVVFAVVEVAGGLAFNSLALLSDAVHMLTDGAAYLIALFAARMAGRPATWQRTYGYARAEILAALVNGSVLMAASVWIVYEAVQRLTSPVPVEGLGVMVIAVVGLLANLAMIGFLLRADRENLNIRAAILHGTSDALSSIGVLAAGAIVYFTGFDRADTLMSFAIAGLVVYASWQLVREAVDVLLDAAPAGTNVEEIADALLACDGVTEVHDLHVWTLGPGQPALSAHVRVEPMLEPERALERLQHLLAERFNVRHSTLQVTRDRSRLAIDAVERLPVAEAVEWANDHIAALHPQLSRSVIMAATGAAALSCAGADRVSPVNISVRALQMLGREDAGERSEELPPPDSGHTH